MSTTTTQVTATAVILFIESLRDGDRQWSDGLMRRLQDKLGAPLGQAERLAELLPNERAEGKAEGFAEGVGASAKAVEELAADYRSDEEDAWADATEVAAQNIRALVPPVAEATAGEPKDARSDYAKLTHDPCAGCEHCRPEHEPVASFSRVANLTDEQRAAIDAWRAQSTDWRETVRIGLVRLSDDCRDDGHGQQADATLAAARLLRAFAPEAK